jgi:hypothetical protein
MSEEIKENTVETTADPAETVNEAPELTVNDLTAIKQVIDVASQRGAFKPNEMVSVGTIYNKLELFLNAVQAQQPKGE